MDGLGIMLSEMSQTETDKYCMISGICGTLKIQLVNIITTITNHTHRYRKQVSGYPWGKEMKMDDIWVGV